MRNLQHDLKTYKIPASSLVKHMGGFIRNTLPCRPPFPTRTPSSSIRTKRVISTVAISFFQFNIIFFGNQRIAVPLSFSNNTAVSVFAGVFPFRSVTSSTPTINPLPRTSPMTGKNTLVKWHGMVHSTSNWKGDNEV